MTFPHPHAPLLAAWISAWAIPDTSMLKEFTYVWHTGAQNIHKSQKSFLNENKRM